MSTSIVDSAERIRTGECGLPSIADRRERLAVPAVLG